MPSPARLEEADPFNDAGRLQRLQDLCTVALLPGLAMYLFEAGVTPDSALTGIARNFGVLPRPAPFPDLLADPAPRPGD